MRIFPGSSPHCMFRFHVPCSILFEYPTGPPGTGSQVRPKRTLALTLALTLTLTLTLTGNSPGTGTGSQVKPREGAKVNERKALGKAIGSLRADIFADFPSSYLTGGTLNYDVAFEAETRIKTKTKAHPFVRVQKTNAYTVCWQHRVTFR